MNKLIRRVIAGVICINVLNIESIHYPNIINNRAYSATSKTYLKNITLSEGNDINFKDDKYSYIIDLNDKVEEVVIRAKPDDDEYKVKINGQEATKDNKYRQTVSLEYGKNTIEVKVKVKDNDEVTYTLYIYIGGEKSVSLNDITIDDREIGFSKKSSFYSIELDDNTDIINLHLETDGDEYEVQVNNKLLSSTNSVKLRFKGIGKYTISVKLTDTETNRENTYTLELYVGIPIAPDVSDSIKQVLKPNQWVIVNGRWRYNDSLGNSIKNSWFYDRNYGKYYHFNNRGNMETGWVQYGNWYYLDEHGGMETGWIHYNDYWYYLNYSGAMETGWVDYNNHWYYLNDDGEMVTGWRMINGYWYLFDSNGVMYTGWSLQNRKWYHMNEDGQMETGWTYIGNEWYYMNPSGDMKSGEWLYYNSNWYYINGIGTMRHSWWLYEEDSQKYYYLNDDGTMNTSPKIIEGYPYKFNSDGSVNFD